MRNRRMISRTISTSEKLHKIDWKARLLFTWLILHCDDEGRMAGSAQTVKAVVLPMADCSFAEIEKWLAEIKKVGLILWYKADGQRYIEVVKWGEYQTFHGISKNASRLPSPPSMVDHSTEPGSKQNQTKQSETKEVNKEKGDFSHLPGPGKKVRDMTKGMKHIGPKMMGDE